MVSETVSTRTHGAQLYYVVEVPRSEKYELEKDYKFR